MAEARWSGAVLDRMRLEGDPLADTTVKAVFDKGAVAAVNDLLTKLVRNDDIPAGPWPPELADYLGVSARLPSWADAALIRTGENVFLRYGLTSFGILACASLPECYVLRDVAAVLGTTQRLDAHARRRIFETAMMVLAVMAEGGLEPGGSGIRIVQKVRLMHAAVRYLILTPPLPAAAGPPTSLADTLLAQRWPAERGSAAEPGGSRRRAPDVLVRHGAQLEAPRDHALVRGGTCVPAFLERRRPRARHPRRAPRA